MMVKQSVVIVLGVVLVGLMLYGLHLWHVANNIHISFW